MRFYRRYYTKTKFTNLGVYSVAIVDIRKKNDREWNDKHIQTVEFLKILIMQIDKNTKNKKLQLIDLLFYFLIQETVFMKNVSVTFIETVKNKLETFHENGIVPNSNLFHLLLFQKELPIKNISIMLLKKN